MSHALLTRADARRIPLADQSIHCIVTSPPYWGLRDYGVDGQIGLEKTPDEYVATMVAVFRDVWRVLRDDGTLWLNLGDSYAGSWGNQRRKPERGSQRPINGPMMQVIDDDRYPSKGGNTGKIPEGSGLKPKDLVGIPWRVALALQADGWYLRSDIIWAKPNPMPESVTDRPTKAHEYLFLLAKNEQYFDDADAIREPLAESTEARERCGYRHAFATQFLGSPADKRHVDGKTLDRISDPLGRNKRSVWQVATRSFKGAHFAVFPPDLIEPCILAGTSERGCCPVCGKPWVRIVEKSRMATRPGLDTKVEGLESLIIGNRDPQRHVTETRMVGWRPGCQCDAGDPVPCIILDPFNGSGTTGVVATGLGRSYVGLDLNDDYLAMAQRRIERPHARPAASVSAEAGDPLPLFAVLTGGTA